MFSSTLNRSSALGYYNPQSRSSAWILHFAPSTLSYLSPERCMTVGYVVEYLIALFVVTVHDLSNSLCPNYRSASVTSIPIMYGPAWCFWCQSRIIPFMAMFVGLQSFAKHLEFAPTTNKRVHYPRASGQPSWWRRHLLMA
jgi:hypothetical protein